MLDTNSIHKKNRKQVYKQRFLRRALLFLFFTLFCVLFDRIYALFSHEVSSMSMTLMFLYPLIGGIFCLLLFQGRSNYGFTFCLLGIITLVLGSLLRGVFEIAGAGSKYLIAYPIAGWILFAVGSILGFLGIFVNRRSR